jgi:disulfide bond formation protein DsbB
MFMKIVRRLKSVSQSSRYWLALIIAGVGLLGTALFYQYVLEEMPCVVCIQIRLLISLLVFVAVIGLFTHGNKIMSILSHLSVVIIAISFVERCYLLLGTEKGFVFADCGFSLGLPAWLAIEDWMPWLYGIETSCGYTPAIVFGITMAEALMLLSTSLLLLSICLSVVNLIDLKPEE